MTDTTVKAVRPYDSLVKLALEGNNDSPLVAEAKTYLSTAFAMLSADLGLARIKSRDFLVEIVAARFATCDYEVKVTSVRPPTHAALSILVASTEFGEPGYECTVHAYIHPAEPKKLTLYVRRGTLSRKRVARKRR